MKNKILLGLFVFVISSCSDETVPSSVRADKSAIVATISADYSSGSHSVISKDDNGNWFATNDLSPTDSDITVAANGTHFYRIQRAFSGNNITKFSGDDAQVPIWQYSTNDVGGIVASNPYDMIFVNEAKAYVLRYGSTKAWIVNPSATREEDFKIGELDLSAYADGDGVPEMSAGVVVKGRLYIVLQRLENYVPVNDAYVAVFDVNSDLEVDANIAGDNLLGIPLQVKNPGSIIHEATSNSLFVQGVGSYSPTEYTGGIEKINITSLEATLIYDDADVSDSGYGKVSSLAVISDSVIYFVGYNGFSDNTLYKFDLSGNKITETGVVSLIHGQISSLSVDTSGLLWVSDSANATVRIIDPETDTETDALYTNLNPDKIVFIK